MVSCRGYADERDQPPATGPNEDVAGHVSEEAAQINRITGETEPDVGQGTPVQDVRGSPSAPQTTYDISVTPRYTS